MKAKLNRLKGHMGFQGESTQKKLVQVEQTKTETIPYESEWSELDVYPYWFDGQYILIREKIYPLTKKHGHYLFEQLQDVLLLWETQQVTHPLTTKGVKENQLLFFDTETTGLSGGAGNTIFLLGFCQFDHESIIVKQYFLPGPESEVALYHAFLTDIGDDKYLVTYNGKAFDWPQVKTRHTFVRNQVPKLPSFGHFDLLHASRRLWKNVLPSCKLKIVEEEELHFYRQADTPSYLVPMLYFDFLQDPNPAYVRSVFLHHEWDVLSLLSLYIHLSQKIIQPEKWATYKETFEIARWFDSLGEVNQAIQLYEMLLKIDDKLDDDTKHNCYFSYGLLLKKQKRHEEALFYFKKCAPSQPNFCVAAIEAAKLLEHQFNDFEQALYYCNQVNTQSPTEDVRKRMKRLTKKIRR
ncbi:ribonuclease H-like domain-containing protein [Halalkalibacter sp. AB-rgal2]|uniref:ribonuclease H-like domain-containing protein n=1 Tax=Halalkalibacter sp. AB-rgal2 TaxID=3242695 RepID=UPI00359E423A